MLCSKLFIMSNSTSGKSNEVRPVLRHLRRSKTINVSQFADSDSRGSNEVSFHDETSREGSTSPPPLPTSSCQALRHAVSALTRIDDFNLEELGGGFFANVYKATHKVTGEEMVMKINKDSANRPSALREVQLMNRLSHPNILRFLGVCVHEGQLHALTEFVSGGTLECMLASKEELPWTLRIKLSLDIAKGMRYLHNEGVFHRDLTSKNVLIKKKERKNYTAIIADFGLATKIPNPNASEPLPTVGCPWWMAPEVIHGNFYDQRADIFSFGIVLLEIATRLEADPESMPRTQKFGVDYIKLSEMVDYCPLDFLQFAFKCCQILPEKRPLTDEVVEMLERIYKNLKNDSSKTVGHFHKRSKSEDNIIQTSENQDDEVFISAHNMAAAMRREDPLYCPSSQNPFAGITRLRDGRKLIEAPTHRKLSTFTGGEDVSGKGRGQRERSISVCEGTHSLPSSPVMLRKAAEKLHQLSLHGREALQSHKPRTGIHIALSKSLLGCSSSSNIVTDDSEADIISNVVSEVSVGSCEISGDGSDADAKRGRFSSGRTRSLGSLDLWTPPRCSKAAASGNSGVSDVDRVGFCNRFTSGIKESSLENLLEPDAREAIKYVGDEEECSTTIEDVEDDDDDDANSNSTYFSVADSLYSNSQERKLTATDSKIADLQVKDNTISTSLARHGDLDRDETFTAGGETGLGASESSSSLSSFLSCGDGDEGHLENNGALPHLIAPIIPAFLPSPSSPHLQQPLSDCVLEVNGKAATIRLVTGVTTSAADSCCSNSSSSRPLIAVETGSYEQDYFGNGDKSSSEGKAL